MDYTVLSKEEVKCLERLIGCFENYLKGTKSKMSEGVFCVYNNTLEDYWKDLRKNHNEKWMSDFKEKLIGFGFTSSSNDCKWSIYLSPTEKLYFNKNSIEKIKFAIAQRKIQILEKWKNFGLNILGGVLASIGFEVIQYLLSLIK